MHNFKNKLRTVKDAFRHPYYLLHRDRQNKELGLAIQFAKIQIQICVEDHSRCPHQYGTYLPTRVIDVGPSDGSKEPRLLVTADMQDDPRPGDRHHQKDVYVALSYCWGKKEPFFTMTRDNLKSMQVQIPWAQLPLTIKDAIHVTRALEIRYLWVDALCIIQDSREDWSAEAARMTSVYSNAFLTISAALGPDVHHGLSRRTTRWEALDSKRTLEDDPLYQRAWALQERVLSPRVLIFGSDELYWECLQKKNSETGELIPRPLCFKLPLNPSDNDWYTIVRDYTCRLMTYESDKLPALAGLAAAYGTATGKSYLVGLWKESLLDDLLWHQVWLLYGNRVPPSLPTQYRAPSWSWASLNGNIAKTSAYKMNNLYTEVLSTFDDSTETRTVSEKTNEWICLQGPLFQTRVENGDVMFGIHQVCALMDYRILDDAVDARHEWKQPMNVSNVWCLLLGTTGTRTSSMEGHGLILARAEKTTTELDFDVYERIGKFLLTGSNNTGAIWESTIAMCRKSTVYII